MSQAENRVLVGNPPDPPPNGSGQRGPTTADAPRRSLVKRMLWRDTAEGREPLSALTATLGVAATLIVAVFAALGVSGDLLARMVRNDPTGSRNVLVLAIVAVVGMAVVTAVQHLPNALVVAPVLLLGYALVQAADVATASQDSRDQPAVSLSLARPASGGLAVTAKATGSGLRAKDLLFLRVTTLAGLANPGELRQATEVECRRREMHASDAARARVLLWTETGPQGTGESTTEQSVPVPAEAQYLCAWAVIVRPSDGGTATAPQNVAVLDVRGLAVSPATPTASASPD